MRSLTLVGSTILALLSSLTPVSAQSGTGSECLRLLGSVACPGFQYAYLSPANLSNAFPFFSDVTDVDSFDIAALNYFNDPNQFRTTKFENQLGCSNASDATIRYQRTVLCSMWVNEKWSAQCLSFYNGTSAATSQKMVCQQTCLEYSASETAIVNNTMYCPGGDLTSGNRSAQLVKDFTDCTNWTTLATNDSATCVMGDANENNCGYGSSTSQLCSFCQGDSPADCCYSGSTDVSVCGYALPVRANSSSTTSSTAGSQTSGSLQDNNGSSSKGLSGGQIAGIVVGSVIGGLLLIAGLVILGLCCLRKKRSNRNAGTRQQPNTSEKGLLGATTSGSGSSPTMGGPTLYAGSGHAKSAESSLMLGGGGARNAGGFGAGMLGAGLAAAPGERVGGVVLPRVRDENQSGDIFIETGAEVTVLWPYQATLPDELDLTPGMKIRVLRLYDDAWGTGEVVGEHGESGRQGAFPIVCVSEGSSLGSGSRNSSNLSH